MKNLLSIVMSAVVILGAGGTLASPAIQNHENTLKSYVCEISDCTQSVNHEHNGVICLAHNENDGHVYHTISKEDLCSVQNCGQISAHEHTICDISDCNLTTNHEHNGIIYYGHSDNDGHDHQEKTASTTIAATTQFTSGVSCCTQTGSHTRDSCGVSGCIQTGSHTHNSCGVSGCAQNRNHIHNKNGDHDSTHGRGHH